MSPIANAALAAKIVRCAIYTRKSTEEGLEKEFNSLDAQRATAEAYIASQQQEGWRCLPATLASLGHVSRARVSQILSLVQLAPDIQETLLFLAPTERGRDPIRLRQLQALAALPDWRHQRRRWQELRTSTGPGTARPPVGE